MRSLSAGFSALSFKIEPGAFDKCMLKGLFEQFVFHAQLLHNFVHAVILPHQLPMMASVLLYDSVCGEYSLQCLTTVRDSFVAPGRFSRKE